MDISILLNKTVTNLWDKIEVQQIKTIIGASQALVGCRPPVGPEGRQGAKSGLQLGMDCWVVQPQAPSGHQHSGQQGRARGVGVALREASWGPGREMGSWEQFIGLD